MHYHRVGRKDKTPMEGHIMLIMYIDLHNGKDQLQRMSSFLKKKTNFENFKEFKKNFKDCKGF